MTLTIDQPAPWLFAWLILKHVVGCLTHSDAGRHSERDKKNACSNLQKRPKNAAEPRFSNLQYALDFTTFLKAKSLAIWSIPLAALDAADKRGAVSSFVGTVGRFCKVPLRSAGLNVSACGNAFRVLLFFVFAIAAIPVRPETLWCRTLGVENGLSQSFVTAMAQDNDGYLWFGTVGGLSRWDGYEFARFSHDIASEHSLSDSVVLALYTDRRGRIWVGTRVGLDEFDSTTQQFIRHRVTYDGSDRPQGTLVECIASDQSGRIWVGSLGWGSLYCYDPRTGKGRVHRLPDIPDRWVTALHVDRLDRLWIATQSALPVAVSTTNRFRLSRLDHCSGVGEDALLPARDVLVFGEPSGKIVRLMSDASDRLWIGREGGGVMRFDPTSNDSREVTINAQKSEALADGRVKSMALGPQGEVWVLTSKPPNTRSEVFELVNRIDPDQFTVRRFNIEESVMKIWNPARLHGLLVDRSGILWIGSNGGGVHHVDVSTGGFEVFRRRSAISAGLNSAFVRAVCVDHSGIVWVGTPEGLNRIDRSGVEVRYTSPPFSAWPELQGIDVKALHEDHRHRLWIGTSQGLFVHDSNTGQMEVHRRKSQAPCAITDEWVQVIHEDSSGRIWLGTMGHGLMEFDETQRCFIGHAPDPNDPTALPNGTIQSLFTAADGSLWVGTDGGLVRLEVGGESKRFRRVPGLAEKSVMTVSQSHRVPGVLWIGTQQHGLCRLDLSDQTCRFFTVQNSGLPDNTIYGILADGLGQLWCSCNQGLFRFDPVEESVQRFGSEVNLQSSEFNALAYCRSADGEMFFGGVGGLNAFRPERLTRNQHPAQIVLAAVKVTDQVSQNPEAASRLVFRHGQAPQKETLIRHSQRDLTFESVAIHHSDPSRNQYQYRLDNYDRDWLLPSSQRRIRYTNLDPGRYTFRVRGFSSHGFVSDQEARFSFEVLPPFYGTWWFRSMVGALFLASVLGGHLWRVRNLRYQQELLESQVSSRTEDLKRALVTLEGQARDLAALDSAKSKFFANLSHEFRTPIMLTVGPLRDIQAGMHGSVTEEARKEIELSLRNANRLLELVDQLLMLARFDAGQWEFRPQRRDLKAYLKDRVVAYRPLAKQQSLRFLVELPDCEVSGDYDETKLDQIFGNLLGNAFKFTPAGGTVILRLARPSDEGWVTVEVEDDGSGIPETDIPRIFDRFYRGEQQNRAVSGAGLGLALAKECVELHGGEITAENCLQGGARFTVKLRGIRRSLAARTFEENGRAK